MFKKRPLDTWERSVLQTCKKYPELTPRGLVLKTGYAIQHKRIRVGVEQLLFASMMQLHREGLIRILSRCGQARVIITCFGVRELLRKTLPGGLAHKVGKQAKLIAVSAATLVAACTSTPRALVAPAAVYGVSEVLHADGPRYELCQDCMQPTQKTLMGARAVAPASSAEAPLRTTTQAPSTSVVGATPLTPVHHQSLSAETNTKVAEAAVPQVVKLYFPVGKAALDDRGRAQLADIVQQAVATGRLVVRGTTDSTGTVAINERLALQRATSAKELLVSMGINPSRIKTETCITCYDDSNNSANGRQKNRRVDIILVSSTRQQGAS